MATTFGADFDPPPFMKIRWPRAVFSLLFCCSAAALSAQFAPENLTSKEPVFSHQYTFLGDPNYYFIDTTFDNLHWYNQWNQSHSDLFGYARPTNMGGRLNPLTFREKTNLWDYFHLGAFQEYFKEEKEIAFYQVRSPLTEANYWMGYNRGHSFNIYHTQNINKYWNFKINFKRLNARGQYTGNADRNRNQGSSFLANTRYHNPKNGYSAAAYFLNEKMTIDESGGLQNVQQFLDNVQIDPALYLLNLDSDRRTQHHREFFIDQSLALNKISFKRQKDSVVVVQDSLDFPNDSLGFEDDKVYEIPPPRKNEEEAATPPTEENETTNSLSIGHSFKLQRRYQAYSGSATDNFYDNYFINSDGDYRDSVGYKSFQNTFYVQGKIGQKTALDVKAGVRNLITQYGDSTYNFSGSNWGLAGELRGNLSDRFSLQGRADYILTGPLNGSLDLGGEAELRIFKKLTAFGSYNFQLKNPDFYQQFYRSNNFIWQNNFEKQGRNLLRFGAEWTSNHRLEISNLSLFQYVYYDENAQPAQSDDAINIFRIKTTQNFEFFNFLHLDNSIIYQTVGGNSAVLPLPEILTRNALYFEFRLFKRALKVLAGGDVEFFTAYNSPSYNPALGDFFVAREREIGNYPYTSIFANFEIRKARIFVKWEHINMGLAGYDFFAAPNYPMPSRALRVGITWRFFN